MPEPVTPGDLAQFDALIDDGDTDTVNLPRATLRQIRDAARRHQTDPATTAENTALKRRLAFIEAGVDTAHPNAKYLIDGWGDAELDQVAITEAANRLGCLRVVAPAAVAPATTVPGPAQPTFTQNDVTAIADRQALASTGPAAGPPGQATGPEHGGLAAIKEGLRVLNAFGSDSADTVAAGVHSLIQSAVAGDARIIIPRGYGGEGEGVPEIIGRKGYLTAREVIGA